VPDKAPATSRSPPPVKAKPAAFSKAPVKKPARTELRDGTKWEIENHEDNREIIISETTMAQTVHLYSCKNSVVQVKGKVNAITMLNCKKTSIVIDSAVSSLSITSSPSFEAQITGSIPTIQIDNTDSGQVYLSKECAEVVEIITAKASAININVPSDDNDYKEEPVPEQFRSKVVNGKLVTEIVQHAG
jgi:adenylyl cyclase-associated protein